MLRNNKRNIRRRIKGVERKSFRDRIRDKIARIVKKQNYVIEESREPEGDKKYVVVYRSETSKGYGEGIVFKGTYKECKELKNELNEMMKGRRSINERNTRN